jgi:hypothetical protein
MRTRTVTTRRVLAPFTLLAALLVPAVAAAAPNLVPNGSFDAGIGGWQPYGGVPLMLGAADADEEGKMLSGSLRIHSGSAGLGTIRSGCFAVQPGTDVVFGASYKVPDAVGTAHGVKPDLRVFSDGACALPLAGSLSGKRLRHWVGSTWQPGQGYGKVPATAHSALLVLGVAVSEPPPAEILVDNAFVFEGATCAAAGTVACLGGGRFRVHVAWATGDDFGFGSMRSFSGADDSAYATFFDPGNVELVVKVLDGCGLNDRFWVFAAGLTDVAVTLTVLDTWTGEEWSHAAQGGQPFAPVLDTSALPICTL